jgi:hypothetical protein
VGEEEATATSFVRHLLGKWPDKLIQDSARNPARWRFLFFHEMAVYGGGP